MKRNAILIITLVALVALAGCKSNGMAVTKRGQFFKININHPMDLSEGADGNLDVVISNRGIKDVKDILVDVDLPPQLIVLDQTNDRGINVMHDPGSSSYHFTLGNVQPGENATLRFHVRTEFGTMRETGSVKVTAWQRDLPGDKLVETAVIKLRS
jgi:hypothetical protein